MSIDYSRLFPHWHLLDRGKVLISCLFMILQTSVFKLRKTSQSYVTCHVSYSFPQAVFNILEGAHPEDKSVQSENTVVVVCEKWKMTKLAVPFWEELKAAPVCSRTLWRSCSIQHSRSRASVYVKQLHPDSVESKYSETLTGTTCTPCDFLPKWLLWHVCLFDRRLLGTFCLIPAETEQHNGYKASIHFGPSSGENTILFSCQLFHFPHRLIS